MVASYRTVLQTRMPAQFTTLRAPLKTGSLGVLANPIISTEAKRPVLTGLMTRATANIPSGAIEHSFTLTDEKELTEAQKRIAAACQMVNRPAPGTMAFATAGDYFA